MTRGSAKDPVVDEHIRAAAQNNAAWCETVWRSHGLRTTHQAGFWATADRAPRLYPDAVTLERTVMPSEILARIDDSAGASIKDSFAVLDLRDSGYEVLFDAAWFRREPRPAGPAGAAWSVVRTPAELATWAVAHGAGDVLRPHLLEDPAVRILVRRLPDGSIAGAIANRAGGVVGVSNVFAPGAADHGWAGLVDTVQALYPGLALVGYDAGDGLEAAVRVGFTPVGPLRVWVRR